MQRSTMMDKRQCWVDIFDSAYFMGRMRRLFGPQRMRKIKAKSVIVGPEATILLSVRKRGKDHVVELAARRVVPNLADSVKGGTIRDASVVWRVPPARGRRTSANPDDNGPLN